MADSFEALNLSDKLHLATLEAGYSKPTPIQAQVIPAILSGRDVVGAAPTGTGKSAAYLLPIIERIVDRSAYSGTSRASALIIVPTKELVLQTRDFLLEFGASKLNIRSTIAFGGVGVSPQIQELRQGTDIVIATPARAVELIERKELILDELSFFVLDEVDRMLQMGFIHDINTIAKNLGPESQCMVFSATITAETAKLAGRLLHNPLTIDIKQKGDTQITATTVKCHTLYVDKGRKRKLLLWLLDEVKYSKVLIFVNSKADAERVGRDLTKAEIKNVVIHGDKPNKERQRAAENFQRGSVKVMVATDLAARGFDVPNLSMVVNFDLPTSVEVFVHRIGRTGRAGKEGEAYSFCDQNSRLLQCRIDEDVAVMPELFPWHPFHSDKIMEMTPEEAMERREKLRSAKIEREKPEPKEKKVEVPLRRKPKVVPTKTGNKVEGRKAKVTGKGRQKSNRPNNKVQKKRGKRH